MKKAYFKLKNFRSGRPALTTGIEVPPDLYAFGIKRDFKYNMNLLWKSSILS